jgi:hypothetical protein
MSESEENLIPKEKLILPETRIRIAFLATKSVVGGNADGD